MNKDIQNTQAKARFLWPILCANYQGRTRRINSRQSCQNHINKFLSNRVAGFARAVNS